MFYLLLIVFFGAHAFLAEIGDGFFHRGVRVDSRLKHGEGKPHREIRECRLEGSVHGVKQSGENRRFEIGKRGVERLLQKRVGTLDFFGHWEHVA